LNFIGFFINRGGALAHLRLSYLRLRDLLLGLPLLLEADQLVLVVGLLKPTRDVSRVEGFSSANELALEFIELGRHLNAGVRLLLLVTGFHPVTLFTFMGTVDQSTEDTVSDLAFEARGLEGLRNHHRILLRQLAVGRRHGEVDGFVGFQS